VTPDEVLEGIRDGNSHAGGIRCLRLLRVHRQFFANLHADVMRLCAEQYPSDVRAADHVTNWTRPQGSVLQFSLLNASGRCDDFSDDHSLSYQGKHFHLAPDYPTLATFIAALPHTINFRVNVLGPRARLAAHEEHSIIRTLDGTLGVCARFHLPIETNPGAEIVLDGQAYHLEAGEVYFINHGCVHAARNGAMSRLHLVWDMLLTRDAYHTIFEAGPIWSDAVPAAERVPAPTRLERMGAALRLRPSVSSAQTASEQIRFCQPQ
jgi:hypothetical protein